MISFSPAGSSIEQLLRYQKLFSQCFPASPKFSVPALHWLYGENPDGAVIGFDAFIGDALVAHYACVPAKIQVGGEVVSGLLSLNTATHPGHQGKGLFSRLAEMTYQSAAEQGYECVYGVANANSTPGFVRKLGFQVVQPLFAKVGVGRLGGDFSKVAQESQFRRLWNSESLLWRCNNPANPVMCQQVGERSVFQARALSRLLSVHAELPMNLDISDSAHHLAHLRLYLGLMPESTCKFACYVDIPQRFRPSPLNLIFRSLTARQSRLEPGTVYFSFLDFDAY